MDNIQLLNNCIQNFLKNTKIYDIIIGEIIETKQSQKHHYLTIKNEDYIIKCNSWNKTYDKLKIGNMVKVYGKLSFLNKSFTLYYKIDDIEILNDIGKKLNDYDELKLKFIKQNMIGNIKKKLCKFPYNIGLITANNSAVIEDMISVFKQKNFIGNLFLKNSIMQGENCPDSIINSLNYFNNIDEIDLIIIFRGGGSSDDLEAFNNENLNLSIFQNKHIIYCAVGHASDTIQLINYVCDKSFGTPSIVSENIIEEQNKYYDNIHNKKKRINEIFEKYKKCKENFLKINFENKMNYFNKKMIENKINIFKNTFQNKIIHYEKYKNIFNEKTKILKPTIYKQNKEILTFEEFDKGLKKIKISFFDKDVDLYYKKI